MKIEHQIIARVYAAKEDIQKADDFIRDYIPFIKKEASKHLLSICTENDDEYSISLMAFHEAIISYEKKKGGFLNYAGLVIKSRLLDYQRKESRHQGHISIHEENEDDSTALEDKLTDDKDYYDEYASLNATKQEIEELISTMNSFGLNLTDIADNSPKQDRTLQICSKAVQYAINNPSVLEDMLRTKKLPMAKLVDGTKIERKTLERHRKYILAMLIIQTNGFEIIRGHIKHVLNVKGGVSA